MRVTITTDGGFTGRGIGSVSADLEGEILDNARPQTWQGRYDAPGADLVRYTLRIGRRSVTWAEGAEIPDDLKALFEAAWSTRS